MKLLCVSILAALGLLVSVANGDEPKSYKVTIDTARIGTVDLKAGEYKLLVHRDGAEHTLQLTEVETGRVTEVAATVESTDRRADQTEVLSTEVNGVKQIHEIRIGGTKFRIAFARAAAL